MTRQQSGTYLVGFRSPASSPAGRSARARAATRCTDLPRRWRCSSKTLTEPVPERPSVVGVERQRELVVPAELEPRCRQRVVALLPPGWPLATVGGVRGDLR